VSIQPKKTQKPNIKKLSLNFLLLCACSSTPSWTPHGLSENPEALFQQICQLGSSIQKATGEVRIKVNNPQLSGNFYAEVVATKNSEVHLTILDLLRGPQASISINPQRYLIQQEEKGRIKEHVEYEHWNSIPLAWSIDLFLGKIPCPQKDRSLSMDLTDHRFIVQSKYPLPTQWIYTLHWLKKGNQKIPIPQSLQWIQTAQPSLRLQKKEVDVQFESFETSTFTYKKWKAHSAQDNIECQWKEKKITLQPAEALQPTSSPTTKK
jgi:hypothetical protein